MAAVAGSMGAMVFRPPEGTKGGGRRHHRREEQDLLLIMPIPGVGGRPQPSLSRFNRIGMVVVVLVLVSVIMLSIVLIAVKVITILRLLEQEKGRVKFEEYEEYKKVQE